MAGCNYDELTKGPNSNNSSNHNNNSNNSNSNTIITSNNENSNNSNNNSNNNNNNNNNKPTQICFRVSSGRDFTVGFESSQTLCDILSRTIYDSKNFWITYNGKELMWYFPLSEQDIRPAAGNLIECRIHARSPKGRKYYDNSCSDMVGFESLCDSDSSVFSEPPNGCLDCQSEDLSACATYGCFGGSPMTPRMNKRIIYDDPTDPLYQKRLYKREYQRKRYASMSLTARQLRLEQMRAYERSRRASETLAEREARLMRLRINQKRRLDTETEADRLRRLQRLQKNQRLRLEIETPEERHKRLIRLRENARLRIERKKAIAQILGMSRRGRHKSTTAELFMKQANSAGDREGGFSCMKPSQKNSSQRDGGYPYMESGNNKNIVNRQDGYSFLNQGHKGANDREDGFSYQSQSDKGVRQEDFYLEPSQKGVADRDGSYYMKPQGENKDSSERRSGFPCMGQIQSKDGAHRARSGGTTFPCMSTSGDKGFETSENGAFSGLNQDKSDRELNFSCLTQDQNKDVGDRAVEFPCLGQESGKNVPSERDGAFSYGLGLAERDGGFPYLKPNYKPTQVDCVRSETMTPRSEDLLNLDSIQCSMMGSDKKMTKGSSSMNNANSNMPLHNIDGQQKNINSSYPYSGLDSEKSAKKKRKKPMYNMADEQGGEHVGLVTKTDMHDVKKGEAGQCKKGPESSRGPSIEAMIQQGKSDDGFRSSSQQGQNYMRMYRERSSCQHPYLNDYGAEMMSARDRKLLKMRLKQRWRMHNETDLQRAKRLLRMKRYQRQRMKNETPEQRQSRLIRMRDNSKRRAHSKQAIAQLFKSSQLNRKRSSPPETTCVKHSKENSGQRRYQYIPNDESGFSLNVSERDRGGGGGAGGGGGGGSYTDSGSKNPSERQEMFQYLNMNEKTVCSGDQEDGFSYLNLGGGEKTVRQDDFSYVDPSQKNANERESAFPYVKSNSSHGQTKENPGKGSVFPCMDQGYKKDVPGRAGAFPGMDQSSNPDSINRGGSAADGASFPGLNHTQEERNTGYQSLTHNPDKEHANRGSEGFHYLNLNNSMDVGEKSEDFPYGKPTQRDQRGKFDSGMMKKKGPDSCTGSAFASINNQDCCEQIGKDGMLCEPKDYIPNSALSRESQRQKRLEQMRQYQRRRLETETPDERQNRLIRMRENARLRSEKKRHVSQVIRPGQAPQKKFSPMEADNLMRYPPLSDHEREANWSCMEQNHKEKSEGFSYMTPADKDKPEDYPYLTPNNKSIPDRDTDYPFMKTDISQGHSKDNPERGSVFPCMDHAQNKNSPERGGIFPCMEEVNSKDIIDKGRTGGTVFPRMTPALNKETPNKGVGVFSCMNQEQQKQRTLDRPGSVSNMNRNQTLTPTSNPNQAQTKDSTLGHRSATYQQYMMHQSHGGKDMISRSSSSSINNSNNNQNNTSTTATSNSNNSGPTLSGSSGMMFPFLGSSQNRNVPDREMGGFPCSLTPDQNSRLGSFSYPNVGHGLGITERDGSYSYIKQTADMRKKYAESAHRKKGSEMAMGSAFASIHKSDGATSNAMAGYPKSEHSYMCASCERPLPKDQLSRFTPFPMSMMGGSGADKLCDDKQWICKTCEKLKRNYHLFPNPVS